MPWTKSFAKEMGLLSGLSMQEHARRTWAQRRENNGCFLRNGENVMSEEWLKDSNGNKCSMKHFGSEDSARKALDSLIDCKNCINCSNCSRCSNCSYCSHCLDCLDCSNCSNCLNCLNCSNCSNCLGCFNRVNRFGH